MTQTRPMSPCINICTLDAQDVCLGCFRSRQEIGAWSTLSAAEQWLVVERAEQRRQLKVQAKAAR